MKAITHKVDMGRTPAKRKFSEVLRLVSPGESGQGLPYAPEDWPNPGDIWCWAPIGKVIKRNGIFKDRYLFAPERLQRKSSKKLAFMSKLSVTRYLQSEFPEADINAFFESFTWDVPAKTDSERKGQIMTSPQSVASQEENCRFERGVEIFKRTRQATLRQKSQGPSGNCVSQLTIDMSIEEQGMLANSATTRGTRGTVFQDDQVSDSHAAGSLDGNVCGSPVDCRSRAPIFTQEEFDIYLSSLDEIFTLPCPGNLVSSKGGGMIEARQKLSSLLAMGFPSLVSSNSLNELLGLTSKLQNDPSLSPIELSMLKLMEEIPLTSQCFLEAKEASVQADKFFVELDSKIASIASLKNEYNSAKEEKEVLQAEEASTLLAIRETNEQIAKLQSRRMALAQTIKVNNRKIVQCTSTQKKVMDCLPKIVYEVQVANSRKAEWELKKKKSAEQEAEILAKFAPLVGFSF